MLVFASSCSTLGDGTDGEVPSPAAAPAAEAPTAVPAATATPGPTPVQIDLSALPAAGDQPTATPVPSVPVAPLTGLPTSDVTLFDRPALMVKIDNFPDARPQVGLNDADQVLEILVEGITRFAFVFHSTESDPVGPIRSGRSSDPNIAANYGQPLFAWSGGNTAVTSEIRSAQDDRKLYDIGAFVLTSVEYFRDNENGRFAPHNLFGRTPQLRAFDPGGLEPPSQMFTYRSSDDQLPADSYDLAGVHLTYTGGMEVDMVWDPEAQGYRRWQNGTPHVDAAGVQVAPPNVVILFTNYTASQADAISPQAITVGEGRALVLTGGRAVQGFWLRPDPYEAWSVVDADGGPIPLTPGQTWILLPKPGETAELDADAASGLLETVVEIPTP